ncbi:TIGR01621 family pseudouridine synthase [Aliikangiella maris]|uniref:TIGR01621 family pseudouridine synthase n=2 Tax=Aliikangiella maris TaxID=3162458 RepID=A0ABV3MP53_9GAMM
MSFTVSIIFQNDDLIIIDKPANISFHREKNQPGFFNQLSDYLGFTIWPVHRLDKVTSGLLIFAKNKVAASELTQLFTDKAIHKVYLAISDNKPNKKQGLIRGDMKKTRNGNWKLTKTQTNPAITQFYSCSLLPGKRFFWVEPQSGKTHQIRVALKSQGSAILGDLRYSGSQADRTYLHAYQLKFNWHQQKICVSCLPQTGEYFLKPELKTCIEQFENRSN